MPLWNRYVELRAVHTDAARRVNATTEIHGVHISRAARAALQRAAYV